MIGSARESRSLCVDSRSRDCDQRDAHRLGVLVHQTFNVGRHCGRALVEHGIRGSVVAREEVSHNGNGDLERTKAWPFPSK